DRAAAVGRRRGLLRPHRRLRLRGAHRPPLHGQAASEAALLMTDEEFEEIVRAALDSLPEEIARQIENVAVVVEDEDPERQGILGSFSGYPRGATMPSGALPGKIVLYRDTLEDAF